MRLLIIVLFLTTVREKSLEDDGKVYASSLYDTPVSDLW